jgi:hypothetical protein
MNDFEISVDLLPFTFTDISLLSKDLLTAYGLLKDKWPKVWVNYKDGKRVNNWCGFRTQECPIGAKFSAHKKGLAMDIHADNLAEVRKWIIEGNPLKITRMEKSESTPTWIHVDFVPLTPEQKTKVCKNGIYVFSP